MLKKRGQSKPRTRGKTVRQRALAGELSREEIETFVQRAAAKESYFKASEFLLKRGLGGRTLNDVYEIDLSEFRRIYPVTLTAGHARQLEFPIEQLLRHYLLEDLVNSGVPGDVLIRAGADSEDVGKLETGLQRKKNAFGGPGTNALPEGMSGFIEERKRRRRALKPEKFSKEEAVDLIKQSARLFDGRKPETIIDSVNFLSQNGLFGYELVNSYDITLKEFFNIFSKKPRTQVAAKLAIELHFPPEQVVEMFENPRILYQAGMEIPVLLGFFPERDLVRRFDFNPEIIQYEKYRHQKKIEKESRRTGITLSPRGKRKIKTGSSLNPRKTRKKQN